MPFPKIVCQLYDIVQIDGRAVRRRCRAAAWHRCLECGKKLCRYHTHALAGDPSYTSRRRSACCNGFLRWLDDEPIANATAAP